MSTRKLTNVPGLRRLSSSDWGEAFPSPRVKTIPFDLAHRLCKVPLRFFPMPKQAPITLTVGDPAPDFSALDQTGKRVSLNQFQGHFVLLYFYPKDNTPGCTKEACAFRDLSPTFDEKKLRILGVSADSVKSHEKFATKFSLPFPLLADTEKEIVQAYGVWGEKSFMGRTFDGIFRASFLIDPKGRIAFIWPKVKAEPHASEVLAQLESMPS